MVHEAKIEVILSNPKFSKDINVLTPSIIVARRAYPPV